MLRAALPGSLVLGIALYAAPLHAGQAPAPTPPAPLASLNVPGHGAVRVDPEGRLSVGDIQLGELVPAGQRPRAARLRRVPGNPALVEVRVDLQRGGRVAAVQLTTGRPAQLLFVEPVGDTADGELSYHLELDGNGARRWQSTPAVARCDGAQPLFQERYDLEAHAWRPAPLPVPEAPALPVRPTGVFPPPRRALRFSSASTDGQSERADRLGAPRELDDGDDGSPLLLGQGPAARGAFMTARAPRAVPLVGLRVAPPPPPARLPAALILIGGTPARPVARLELGTGPRSFALPAPLSGSCVSLVVDEPAASNAPLGLGEVTLYAADDAPEGLAGLARIVASDGADAEGAARSLEADPGGAAAALAALDEGSLTGRRRLLAVVRTQARRLAPTEAPRLVQRLSTAHAEERPLLVEILASLGAPVLAPVESLLRDTSQPLEAKEDGLAVLARLTLPEAETRLFDALAEPPLRRSALAHLTASAPRRPLYAVSAARRLAAPLDDETRAALVAVIGAGAPALTDDAVRAEVVAAIEHLGQVSQLPFELGVRILSSLARLGGPPHLGAVGQVLKGSSDASLRLVAIASLPSAAQPGPRLLYISALSDGDAAVRERALARLVATPEALAAAQLVTASDDRWPQIRRLAYTGLGTRCATGADRAAHLEPGRLLDARVFGKAADADARARAAALSALSHCPDVRTERIAAAVAKQQPAEVREQAAQLLAARGPQVLPIIVQTLDKVFQRGGAELPDTAIALLRAIGRVGEGRGSLDDATLVILRDSAGDPFYPGIRMAALEALSRACPDGAKVVFDRADKDPEPAVQRSSSLARARCGR